LDSIGYKDTDNAYYEFTMNGQKIGIAGLDDCTLGMPDANKIKIDTMDNCFNIMLEHSLDGYAPLQENHQFVDLALSGHFHSGEIE
jgi:predicted MPP superfamily phosphohydrolase